MRFPSISARDLENADYVLPDDLPGTWRLVLMPFKRWQQIVVGAWIEALEPLTTAYPELTVWEVPTLSSAWTAARGYIDGGMRAGIPDVDVRRHTLTAYTPLNHVAKELDIPSFDEVQVFLLDAAGEIVWRSAGEPDTGKATALADVLAAAGAGS